MGRITIFSIEECNYCRRTKAALSSRDIPFSNINVESYPSRRSDMISLTDRTSVPQVFWNDEYVGGSEETLARLKEWDDGIAKKKESGGEGADETPHDVYVRLVESLPDPTDARLALPSGPPEVNTEKMDLESPRSTETFSIDGGREYSGLELTRLLVERMPRESLAYWGVRYYNVFKGSDGVACLQKIFELETKEQAAQLGVRLQDAKYLRHCTDDDHAFGDNGYYFRLAPFHTPQVLNSFRAWPKPDAGKSAAAVDGKPMFVVHRLGKLWSKLESRHLDEGSGMIDHADIRGDELYWKFEDEACELQSISMHDMADDGTRKAFVVNVYNLMIKYAFVKVGIPASTPSRSSFYSDVSVNVGGHTYSFDDLEHGILRCNTRHPYQLSKRFGKSDPRAELALKGPLDPRVHFALNCGAKSCPPVKKYTAEAIDEELRLAAASFCEQDGNVCIDEARGELRLSKILHWYQSDFVPSKGGLPRKLAELSRGKKKELLDRLVAEGKKLSIKFVEYDWSTNNTNNVTYEKGDLASKSSFPYPRSHPPQRYEAIATD